MKHTILFFLLFTKTLIGFAQQKAAEDCNCPMPITGKFVQIEMMVENKDMGYKEAIMEMSCADKIKDSKEVIRQKVNCMWEKYYSEFGCNSTGFLVANGNILKYAVNQEFVFFIDGMVKHFGININKKDPSDGETLLDFVLDEINRYKKDNAYPEKPKELQKIYNHLKNDLNAKHASEL